MINETTTPKDEYRAQQVQQGKPYALLSYLFVAAVIPCLLIKENEYVTFHVKQGLVLMILELAVIVLSVFLPWLVKPVFFMCGLFSVWGLVDVAQGRWTQMPVIYEFAKSIKL